MGYTVKEYRQYLKLKDKEKKLEMALNKTGDQAHEKVSIGYTATSERSPTLTIYEEADITTDAKTTTPFGFQTVNVPPGTKRYKPVQYFVKKGRDIVLKEGFILHEMKHRAQQARDERTKNAHTVEVWEILGLEPV